MLNGGITRMAIRCGLTSTKSQRRFTGLLSLTYNGGNMNKPVILTGLRANNNLHIGNYLGALLPIVDLVKTRAGEYQINLFVPDLHSFTTPIDHSQLQQAISQNLRVYVAAGLPLDNADIYIYRQSYIPAHSELA